jgi:hypothetical protein
MSFNKKKFTLLRKNVINITKFVKCNNTTGNQLLYVQENRVTKDHKDTNTVEN